MIMMTMINDHAHDDRDDDPGQPVQWVGTRWEAHRSDEPSSEVMPCPGAAPCTPVLPCQQMVMPNSCTTFNQYQLVPVPCQQKDLTGHRVTTCTCNMPTWTQFNEHQNMILFTAISTKSRDDPVRSKV